MENNNFSFTYGNDCTDYFLSQISKLVDKPINTLATSYITDETHYAELYRYAMKCGSINPSDTLSGVYECLKIRERRNNGYEPEKGSDNGITIAEYIHSVIKFYLMRMKSAGGGAKRLEDEQDIMQLTPEEIALRKRKGIKRKVIKDKYLQVEVAASSSDSVMRSYENSADKRSEEEFNRVEDEESIESYLYILYGRSIDSAIYTMLFRLQEFGNIDTTVFNGIKRMVADDKEFAEALWCCMEYMKVNPDKLKEKFIKVFGDHWFKKNIA